MERTVLPRAFSSALRASSRAPALAAACVLALARAPAAAQEPAPELSATVRAPRPAADGASASRVEAESYAGELRHAGELATSAPGAMPLDYGGALATSTVSLRGASADEVRVVFDGSVLNSPAGGGFDLSRLPAALVDAVEVRRGADARAGAGAMGGTLSLEPVAGTRALATAGTLGTYGLSGSLAREKPAERGTWRLLAAADVRRSAGDFEYHRDPNPDLPGRYPAETLRRANNDALLASVLARAGWRGAHGFALSGLLLGSWLERGLAGDVYNPTPDARQGEWSGLAALTLRARAGSAGPLGPLRLEVPLSARAGRLSTSGGGLPGTRQGGADVAVRPVLEATPGPWRLALAGDAGGEWYGDAAQDRQRLHGALGLEAARAQRRWTASAALRGEWWGSTGALLPRAGGSVRAGPVVFFGNAGAGFRPPSFDELYLSSGPVLANAELRPERAWSGDLGVRVERGAFLAGVAGFAALYRDIIVYELVAFSRTRPLNVGRARMLGGEAELRWAPKEGALRGLGASAALTGLSATNLVPGNNSYGNALPYRPAARVVARAEYARGRGRGALEAQATGGAWSNRANTTRVDGWVDVRASAGARLVADLWLSAEVRNALGVEDRAIIDRYPLPGRVLLAHLSWEPRPGEEAR